jgi:hypothetical protein
VSTSEVEAIRTRYIDLLKRSILGHTYLDNELRIRYLKRCAAGEERYDPVVLRDIAQHDTEELIKVHMAIEAGNTIDLDVSGLPFAHTMIGRRRLENLEVCVRQIIADDIPGDLMECGVWRGGASAFMRGLLEAYQVPDRVVWVADSFAGLPPPTAPVDVADGRDISAEKAPSLVANLDTVMRTFDAYGLLDNRVRFIKGWFKNTLPRAPVERLALLRLDGDMYESTRDTLVALYDKVSPGGFVVIDDLFLPPCRQAVEEFRAERGIDEPTVEIDWTGAYWRKKQ